MQMNEFFYGGHGTPQWQGVRDERTVPTYEFRVPTCCLKCEEKVREELSELEGVLEFFVDRLSELVTVTGFVDPFQALKKLKRIKKKSDFWAASSRPSLKSSLSFGGHHHHHSNKLSAYKHHYPRPETVYHSSYNRAPSSSYRTNYGPIDEVVSYRIDYNPYVDGVSYRTRHSAYGDGVPYRNKYGGYVDGVAYSDLRPSSTLSGLPRSRPLRYEYAVPPYAQDYYTDDYVEDYPVYNRY